MHSSVQWSCCHLGNIFTRHSYKTSSELPENSQHPVLCSGFNFAADNDSTGCAPVEACEQSGETVTSCTERSRWCSTNQWAASSPWEPVEPDSISRFSNVFSMATCLKKQIIQVDFSRSGRMEEDKHGGWESCRVETLSHLAERLNWTLIPTGS